MKYLIIAIAFLFSISLNAQRGYVRPGIIGWPIDSSANAVLGWNASTDKAEWMLSSGGGDSIVITNDSICVIYLGDTICVSAASDSFYLSGDTSLCVISMGDTLCSPYSSAGTTIYTGNGSLTSFRTLFMNAKSLKFDHNFPNGEMVLNQTGVFPMFIIDGDILGNDQSSLLELGAHSVGDGDVFMRFNGVSAVDYSFGVSRLANVGPLTISEGEELTGTGRPFIQFHNTGDSIVIPNDLLAGGAALRIRSHSTAAFGSGQKGLEVFLRGANATAAQSTYAGYFENTHTGSVPFNYGVYATTNAALGAAISGNNSSGGKGVEGICSSGAGAGVYGSSSAGYGIQAISNASTGAAIVTANNSSTNGNATIAVFSRETTGTAADGIEGQIPIVIETDGGSPQTNSIHSYKWVTAANASRTGRYAISGVSSGTTNEIIYLEGDKRVRFNGRAEETQGADIASATTISLGYDGNTFEITGTSAVEQISNIGWQNGSRVTLFLTSACSFDGGTANSGTDIGLKMNGGAGSQTGPGVLTLVLGEIGGDQKWRETSFVAY